MKNNFFKNFFASAALLIALLTFSVTPSYNLMAQNSNELQYPWLPHLTITTDTLLSYDLINVGRDTVQELELLVPEFCAYWMDREFELQITDIMQLAIRNSLTETTNANTLGLVNQRFPSSLDYDQSLRFLAILTYEISLEFPSIVEEVKSSIVFNSRKMKYIIPNRDPVAFRSRTIQERARKIVETMKWFEDNGLPAISGPEYVDFVRDSAMVQLGEKIGIKIQTSNTGVRLNVHGSAGLPIYYTLGPNKTIYVATLNGLSNVPSTDASSRGATLTGMNGASLIHTRTFTPTSDGYTITNNPDHLLNEDQTYQMTIPIQIWGVRSSVIVPPAVLNRLPDISVAVGVTESVNISNLFTGQRITITAESSDVTKATVQMNESKTSIGVVARAAGKSTITVTGSNESGEETVTFVVTVTAATGD